MVGDDHQITSGLRHQSYGQFKILSSQMKSVDHIMNTFVFGQRIKPEIFETPFGNADLGITVSAL